MTSDNAHPRVVVDTNQIVSGLLVPRGLSAALLRAIADYRFRPVLSIELEGEYWRVVSRRSVVSRIPDGFSGAARILTLVARSADYVLPSVDVPVDVRDPNDAIVIATAIGGHADYIVTGDADLLVLDGEPALGALRIVTVRAFLDALDARG